MKGKAVETFEELQMYQRARELINAVYGLTRKKAFAQDFGLVNQIRRSGISILSNIAEGFERGSAKEFIQFLYIAKGSSGEVRAQLQIAFDQKYVNKDDYIQLVDLCRHLSAMISKFITHLKRSDYNGEKFTKPRKT
jgi:four helix bundle protein